MAKKSKLDQAYLNLKADYDELAYLASRPRKSILDRLYDAKFNADTQPVPSVEEWWAIRDAREN